MNPIVLSFENLERAKSYPFYRQLEKGHHKQFCDSLETFREELNITESEIEILREYFKKRDKTRKKAKDILKRLPSKEYIEDVEEDIRQSIALLSSLSPAERVFYPKEFAFLATRLREELQRLEKTYYPKDRLDHLKQQASNLLTLPLMN